MIKIYFPERSVIAIFVLFLKNLQQLIGLWADKFQMNNKSPEINAEFSLTLKIPEFVSFILERLGGMGFRSFIVGGAIRDTLIGREILDWDMATEAKVHEIKNIFNDISHFSLKHETVTLVDSGISYEITSMRGDNSKKADIFSDLSHRDFTLNAMAYDAKENIVLDPFYGASDIKMKKVKAVNDPAERFSEDPLRMLRAIRIAGELGFEIDKTTLKSIPLLAPALAQVSFERIRDEFVKIIICDKPSGLLSILRETGLLEYVIPELLEGIGIEQNQCHQFTVFEHILRTTDNAPTDHISRLAALLHDIGKPRVKEKVHGRYHFYNHEGASAKMAGEIMERLRFSRDEIRKVTELVLHHMINYSKSWGDAAVRRLINRAGVKNIDYLIALRKADIIAHGKNDDTLDLIIHLEQRISEMKNDIRSFDISGLALDGKKVMDILGIGPGPDVGTFLRKLLELTIDNPDINSAEKLTEILIGLDRDNNIHTK